jgi:hypothetical protein
LAVACDLERAQHRDLQHAMSVRPEGGGHGLVGYEAPSTRDVRSNESATESIVKGIRNAEKWLHLQ